MEPEKDIFEQWADERASKSWISRKLEFIPMWWERDGRYSHREFARGVRNIIYWFPIIWKDRNWDSHYIFEILKHKLTSQANYIAEQDRHTRAQKDARDMKHCVKLMRLVQDGFYETEYGDYHKTKNWFEPLDDNTGSSTWESREIEENFDDYFAKYPLIHKRVLNGEGPFSKNDTEKSKQVIAMNIGNINQERAHKLLFKIMERNILGWWD